MVNNYKDLSLFNNVSKIIKPIIEKRGIYIYQIIEDWYKIIQAWDIMNYLQKQDPQINSKIYPAKIDWNKKSQTGTLYIVVPSQYYIFVNHDNISLRNALNKYFGYNAIKNIIFVKS